MIWKGVSCALKGRALALCSKQAGIEIRLQAVMRDLSPREIRLTSPRLMTPNMAARVATLQRAPALPPRPVRPPMPLSAASAPTLAKSISMRSISAPKRDVSAAPITAPLPPAWPALPHDSPDSPSFTMPVRPARPHRPPSPNIKHARTLSHTLSPELVDQLTRTPTSPTTPRSTRSVSLKALRHQMSARNLHISWKDKSTPVGLFRDPSSPAASTFPSMTAGPPSDDLLEFGVVDLDALHAARSASSTGSKSPKGFSRMLPRSFGFGSSTSSSRRTKRPSADLTISPPVAASFHRLEDSAVKSQHARVPSNDANSPRTTKRKPVPGPNDAGKVSPAGGVDGKKKPLGSV